MTPGSDPYRTLGLDPGATPAEVKRAYRRLAKANHPDSAGERALPRFLAIQAAYERLTEDQPGSSRAARRPTDGRSANEGPAAPPPGRSWRADAERARATREAYRRRGGRANPPGAAAGAG
ncbi:MAG: J domain-containing protein, partial [Candidatus Limnocylindrales bacterium]